MPKKQVAKKENTEVQAVDWEAQMAAEANAVAKTERVSANRINFQSGVMTYMDQALPDNELDCIIVASAWENVYYVDRWKAGVVKPPACFALGIPHSDGTPPTMIPHEDVPEPQADGCKSCPKFEWGSDPEGGRGKACKEKRRLAVLPAPSSAEDLDGSDMALMTIPVMSVKNWAAYVNQLAATMQRPTWGVLTKVKLVPDAKSQFKVTFEALELLAGDYLPHVHARIDSAVNALMTPYEMSPQEDEEEGEDKSNKY